MPLFLFLVRPIDEGGEDLDEHVVAEGRSYRLIGRELGLSKNTVVGIIKRNRAPSAES